MYATLCKWIFERDIHVQSFPFAGAVNTYGGQRRANLGVKFTILIEFPPFLPKGNEISVAAR